MKQPARIAILSVTLWFIAAPCIAGPREIELRGTLLCRVDGDPHREKAMDGHFLVIEPDGYPKSSEVLDEAGFFRLRLPASCVDQHVVLKVLRDREEVHLIRVFVERARLRKNGDRAMYQLGAFALPGQCQDFIGSQSMALAVRDDLRQSADTLSAASRGGGVSKPVVGGVLGAVLSGLGFAIAPGSATGGPAFKGSPRIEDFEMPPGDWPLYTQWSSSPSLGRTLTATRLADESVFWNPSSLVSQVGNRLMAAGGEKDEYRASGVYHLPVDPKTTFLVPRTISAGFLGFFGSDSKVESVGPDRVQTDFSNEERLFFVGLGFALTPAVAVGINYNDYRQVFGSSVTVGEGEAKRPTKTATSDVDLSLTWDARPDLRFGAVAYHVGGTEARDLSGREIPLQRGAVGASWITGDLLIGGEFGMSPGKMQASLGLNYRLTDALGLDLSAGSRFETIQGGVDLQHGPVTTRFRIRTDDHEHTAIQLGMGITR